MEELFVYLDNKDKFTKPLKRKIFHDGIIALEKELKSDKGKAATLEDLKGNVERSEELENFFRTFGLWKNSLKWLNSFGVGAGIDGGRGLWKK